MPNIKGIPEKKRKMCVKKVMGKVKDESSAWAICTASLKKAVKRKLRQKGIKA